MRNKLGRRPADADLPADATESWDAEANSVVVHLPVNTSRFETHESADALADRIVAVVDAINAGNIGADVIPADAVGPTVRIRLEPTHRDLGSLEQRTVEIFQERLGVSIPLDTAPGANPPEEPEDESDDPATPSVRLAWKKKPAALAGNATLPVTAPDSRTARLLQATMDAVFVAVRDAPRETIPDGKPARFAVRLRIPAESSVGPRTTALIEQIAQRLGGTTLDVTIVTGETPAAEAETA